MAFRIDQIDHIELVVPCRRKAAEWYENVLGLEVVAEYQVWSEDPKGPLMIQSPFGQTKIALFRGEAQGSKRGTGFHRLAFRTDAKGFLSFLKQLDTLNLDDGKGSDVDQNSVVDHQLAFSIYFCDPWQNELELTTYEHDAVSAVLSNVDRA